MESDFYEDPDTLKILFDLSDHQLLGPLIPKVKQKRCYLYNFKIVWN